MEDIREDSFLVRKAARIYGGSFIKGLFGDALPYADGRNMAKIRNTWAKEWNQYLEMGKNMPNFGE